MDLVFEEADLLAAASKTLEEPRSPEWIRTLIRDGLLDRPQPRGIAGHRGGRRPGTWPESQWLLFGELLAAMRNGADRQTLYNMAIDAWVQRGSEHVPVRQVRRILRTAARHAGSRRAARHTAKLLSDGFAGGPGQMSRSQQKRFIDAFERAVHDGVIDRAALHSPAFDPDGIAVGGPEILIWLIQTGHAVAAKLDTLDDNAFELARRIYHQLAALFHLAPALLRNQPAPAGIPEALQANTCALILISLGLITEGLPEISPQARFESHTSAPRPLERPGATAHGEGTSECTRKLPRRARAASSSPTGTDSRSASRTGT
jgi:hypothetical protein